MKLVALGVLDVPALIARLTTGPARLLGIRPARSPSVPPPT
jgi:hypothetical protein